jgi:hypothetical protein
MIRITTTGKPVSPETQGAQPSASSIPPADQPKPNSGNGFASPDLRTLGTRADGSTGGNGSPARINPLKSNTETGADARHPRQSTPENTSWRARL